MVVMVREEDDIWWVKFQLGYREFYLLNILNFILFIAFQPQLNSKKQVFHLKCNRSSNFREMGLISSIFIDFLNGKLKNTPLSGRVKALYSLKLKNRQFTLWV